MSTTPAQEQAIAEPECYVLPPTKYVPNNPMPVLIYRNVLPHPRDEQTAQAFVEKHGWDRKVRQSGPYPLRGISLTDVPGYCLASSISASLPPQLPRMLW